MQSHFFTPSHHGRSPSLKAEVKFKPAVIGRACAIAGLWLLALVGCQHQPQTPDLSSFATTTNILFVQHGFGQEPDRTLRLTDTNEVRHLVSLIQLKPKENCMCAPHELEAIFQTRTGELRVSLCDHCFAVVLPRGPSSNEVAGYWMPKEFYQEFRQLALSRGAGKWDVPPPRGP
jgi:hypothetical protein